LSDGVATTVTAEAFNVNVTVNTTAVASFGETSLVVDGDLTVSGEINTSKTVTALNILNPFLLAGM
jgi:hypothetical protein